MPMAGCRADTDRPMPILLILLAAGVFAYLWWTRRGTTLTRNCRWRLDRSLGQGAYRCAYCGATELAPGGAPRDCRDPAREA